ncbi:TPA_asm: replication initiator protein [Microviridae sp.]|nr:TPA_asm: replication initiator protein [Microviridae sp.]
MIYIAQVTPNHCDNPFNGMYPCGRCAYCMRMKAWRWRQRLMLEMLEHDRTWFVTLTYADNAYFSVTYKDVQLFLKRIRKDIAKQKEKIRYFAVFEKGEKNGRAHWHLLIFCTGNVKRRTIERKWTHGFTKAKLATPETAAYLTKYISKGGKYRGSNGIGHQAIKEVIHASTFQQVQGVFLESIPTEINGITLPRGLVNKLIDQWNVVLSHGHLSTECSDTTSKRPKCDPSAAENSTKSRRKDNEVSGGEGRVEGFGSPTTIGEPSKHGEAQAAFFPDDLTQSEIAEIKALLVARKFNNTARGRSAQGIQLAARQQEYDAATKRLVGETSKNDVLGSTNGQNVKRAYSPRELFLQLSTNRKPRTRRGKD